MVTSMEKSNALSWSQINGWSDLLAKLHSIEIGGRAGSQRRLSSRTAEEFFDLLAVLLENGLSLQKALATIDSEGTMRQHQQLLTEIRTQVEAGEPFSKALANYPKSFDRLTVKQLSIAEKSGRMVESLRRIAEHLARSRETRTKIIKKISYPCLVATAGTGLIIFMMVVVIPQFEDVYAGSDVQLPWITRCVSATSRWLYQSGWAVLLALVAAAVAVWRLRRIPWAAVAIDRFLIRLPLIGIWVRDASVLQFVDTVNTMLESGFVPADAISDSVDAVSNRAVRNAVKAVRVAIIRGERLSEELSNHPEIFPVAVSQLVIVGEQTGSLAKATRSVRDHLVQRIEARTNAILATLEPVLTILLASAIGSVVLAIYMPMFHMFEVLE